MTISSRLDITYSVCKQAQRNQNPYVEHEKAAKYILQFSGTTKHLRLKCLKSNAPSTGFVDADFASCTENRRSYTGVVFL